MSRPWREVAGIGNEGLAVALERLFDHRMPAALDGEGQRCIDVGPHIIVVDRELGESGCNIEHGKSMRGGAQVLAGGDGKRAEPFEDFQFQPQRAVAGVGDLGFDLAEFSRGEADLAAKVWRWMKVVFSGGASSLS